MLFHDSQIKICKHNFLTDKRSRGRGGRRPKSSTSTSTTTTWRTRVAGSPRRPTGTTGAGTTTSTGRRKTWTTRSAGWPARRSRTGRRRREGTTSRGSSPWRKGKGEGEEAEGGIMITGKAGRNSNIYFFFFQEEENFLFCQIEHCFVDEILNNMDKANINVRKNRKKDESHA